MDSDKMTAVKDWPVPQTTIDVPLFIAVANLYQLFIHNFSGIVRLLMVLARKSVKFKRSEECQRAFQTLIEAFVTA